MLLWINGICIYIYIYMERNERYRNASMAKWIRNSPRSKLGPSSNLGHSVQIFPRIFSRKFPSTIFRNNLSSTKKKKERRNEKKWIIIQQLSLCVVRLFTARVFCYMVDTYFRAFSHTFVSQKFLVPEENGIPWGKYIYKEEKRGG